MTHQHRDDFEELFPYIPKTELAQAESRFRQYLELVLRIHERLLADPEAYAELQQLLESRWDSNSVGANDAENR